MVQASSQAFFLPAHSPESQRYCVHHVPPAGTQVRGCVLYVHPFAEEMNKSRRMAALQARALAQAGYAVLQIDLHGCGDSSGDFGDATWQAWVEDVQRGCEWLRARHAAPLWLWGLRMGCLVAVEAARRLSAPCHFLFWAAPGAGRALLQQFLRLKAAAEMLDGQAKGATEGLRQQLAAGQAVEIAGYLLNPALAQGLEQAALTPPAAAGEGQRLEWLEISPRVDATLSPAAQKAMQPWQQGGWQVRSHLVHGPAFWQTTEIEDAPALLQATLDALAAPPVVATTETFAA